MTIFQFLTETSFLVNRIADSCLATEFEESLKNLDPSRRTTGSPETPTVFSSDVLLRLTQHLVDICRIPTGLPTPNLVVFR